MNGINYIFKISHIFTYVTCLLLVILFPLLSFILAGTHKDSLPLALTRSFSIFLFSMELRCWFRDADRVS
jgi:uncharacterized protein YhhL (DUF1145 family)